MRLRNQDETAAPIHGLASCTKSTAPVREATNMGVEGSKLSPPGKDRSNWPKKSKRALWKRQLSASKAAKRLKERKNPVIHRSG
jgi:hypothetical protein